jgi:UDP-N-acetylglucosamine--N-acetylmuramyl-(pentapeptide) pyrophosphoryl-undecaprenol N-acetylglucosamine transferase
MPPLKPPTLVVAGGGTGGHVLAGVAVADAWKARHGKDAPVLFVGAQGGIEEKLVPRAGYPLELLQVGALNRVSLAKRLKTACQLPLSLARSFLILHRAKPQAVLGVGGYASGPLVLAARLVDFCFPWARIRTAILEQNSVPGLTNRWLGAWVHRVFVAFPGVEGRFRAGKAQVTGNPVRPAIRPRPAAPRTPFVVFIFGGSQGAMGINSLVIEALAHLTPVRDRLRFIHQTGEKDFARVEAAHRAFTASGSPAARVERFLHDMPECYAQASLLICRAGSSTLSELAAVGRASVLVPFPQASDNHQEKNARIFTDRGAGQLMIQGQATGADLARFILEALADPSRIDAMEREVAKFYRPDSAKEIVEALSPH